MVSMSLSLLFDICSPFFFLDEIYSNISMFYPYEQIRFVNAPNGSVLCIEFWKNEKFLMAFDFGLFHSILSPVWTKEGVHVNIGTPLKSMEIDSCWSFNLSEIDDLSLPSLPTLGSIAASPWQWTGMSNGAIPDEVLGRSPSPPAIPQMSSVGWENRVLWSPAPAHEVLVYREPTGSFGLSFDDDE